MMILKKRFVPIALLLCFTLSLSLTGCSASSAQPFSKTGFYFDTVISLTCYGNDAEAVLNEAFELCGHYENLLSYTKEGSDIWNINHANGQPVTVDSETASLLQTALYWSEKTDGLIDPTITPISRLWNFPETRQVLSQSSPRSMPCSLTSITTISGSTAIRLPSPTRMHSLTSDFWQRCDRRPPESIFPPKISQVP